MVLSKKCIDKRVKIDKNTKDQNVWEYVPMKVASLYFSNY